MKKLPLLFLLLSINFFPQYTAIPDANFEDALVAYDDVPGDNRIPTANINSITELDLYGKGISDLTGIANFTSLETFNCGNNNLTTLDLSSNINLKSIGCSFNNNLTALNFSSNLNLETISCNSNANLSSLDISNLTKVVHLAINNTQIASLDLSQLTELYNLYANNASLTQLDITNNIKLNRLRCSYNNLTELDLTNNVDLRYIECQSNNIQTLNLSNIPNLLELDFINNDLSTIDFSNNINIREIKIGYNNLSSIDLSNNLELTELSVNRCTNLALLDISKNTKLTLLAFNFTKISSIDLSDLALLQRLDIQGTEISELDLSNNPLIIGLWCRETKISTLDLTNQPNLAELYSYDNSYLTSIDLRNGTNTTKLKGFSSPKFENLPNLRCINVDDTSFSSSEWTEKDDHIIFSENCSLEAIYTAIPDANFEQALIDLNIDSDNTINGRVLTADINSITTLNIGNKDISDLTGIEDFVALTNLQAGQNTITGVDISNLTELEYVSFFNNELNSLDVTNNTKLTTLFINGNNLISIDLSNNLLLEDLSIHENEIDVLDVSENTSLEILTAYDNSLIAVDLTANILLEEVYLDNNNLESLNIKNGSNTLISDFEVTNNPNLFCIEVDDVAFSTSNWTSKDDIAVYNLDCESTLSLTDVVERSISIYPNPAREIIHIKGTIDSYQLSNNIGIIIKKGTENTIDVSTLSSGIYYLQFTLDNKFYSEKLLIE